jgi:hypothetical protein
VKAVIIKGILLGAAFLPVTGLSAGDQDKPVKMEAKVVDAGSFGIYLDGKRIGTETFKIEQRADYSIATAQLKVDDGKVKAEQSAEMQISPKGELRSYVWRSAFPQKEESSVEPQNELLVEHLIPADQKKMDVPHLLPVSTVILDDNFFSQREILFFRYLATACVWKQGQGRMCGPSDYVVLVPRQHLSANATMEFVGLEKTTVKGVARQLNKVTLTTGAPDRMIVLNDQKEPDPGQWLLWVDDQYRVIRISIPGSNIEVVRD